MRLYFAAETIPLKLGVSNCWTGFPMEHGTRIWDWAGLTKLPTKNEGWFLLKVTILLVCGFRSD